MENEAKVTKESVAEQSEDLSRVLKDDKPLDSIVKPVVEGVTQTVQSLLQNAADHASSYVAQVKTGFEAKPEHADLDEHSRDIHTEPLLAVAAEERASWKNCCGLLDVLRPSEH